MPVAGTVAPQTSYGPRWPTTAASAHTIVPPWFTSASFALLVYVSAWLKCHEPAAFTCALLNSQPMGFYAPSQLVQDARRHGVTVRPVDVAASDWDCTLEQPAPPDAPVCMRLGMRMIGGLTESAARRIVAARRDHAFADTGDLAARAGLDRRDLNALARAGALESIAGHRRHAMWQVTGTHIPAPLIPLAALRETTVSLPAPAEAHDIVADYASLGLSLRRHPLALLRPALLRRRLMTAAQISELSHARPARAAGLVTGRQRPATASGIIFVTLEDETGYVNVIVRSALAERQRRELLGARLLAVYGTLEREGEVVHLVAAHLQDLSALIGALASQSRNFH